MSNRIESSPQRGLLPLLAANPRRLFAIVLVEAAFFTPFWLVPIYAMVSGGDGVPRFDTLYSMYVSAALAVITAYSRRFFGVVRSILILILGLGSIIATSSAFFSRRPVSRFEMFSVIDTSRNEAAEFFSTYFSTNYFLFALAALTLLIPCVALYLQLKLKLYWVPPRRAGWIVLILFFVVFTLGHVRIKHLTLQQKLVTMVSDFPGNLLSFGHFPPLEPYFALLTAIQARSELLSLAAPDPLEHVTIRPESRGPRTFVVVIGEAHSKFRMHLYGYGRPTTPKLDLLNADGEISVFRDVVTPHAHTVPALAKALTLSAEGKRRTIIDVFNAAGFKTYWLSNQYEFGTFESGASLLARAATAHVWLNGRIKITSGHYTLQHYDEELLPVLDEILGRSAEDKVIFLHLIGSHAEYGLRYPSSAAYFTQYDSALCHSPAEAKIINEYDNSIRYNDFVVNEIISRAKKLSGESFVVYFSDHGEEVYDFRKFFGHTDTLLSPYMMQVPMTLWLSPDYKRRHSVIADALVEGARRSYSIEDLSYTLADLARVTFPGMDLSRSVVSPQFVPRPRTTAGRDSDAFMRDWAPDMSHAAGIARITCAPEGAATEGHPNSLANYLKQAPRTGMREP